MKTFQKNQPIAKIMHESAVILAMQTNMTRLCIQQDLRLTTVIGVEVVGDTSVPYMGYQIRYNDDDRILFSGQARTMEDQHYMHLLSIIKGEMVSEIFPPSIRTVTDANGKPETISYWKRFMTVEHDITSVDHISSTSKPTDEEILSKIRRHSSWYGYNSNGAAIACIKDGTKNDFPASVDRIQHTQLGPRGNCVIVIFKTLASMNTSTNMLKDYLDLKQVGSSASVVHSSAAVSASVSFPKSTVPSASADDVSRALSQIGKAIKSATPEVKETKVKVKIPKGQEAYAHPNGGGIGIRKKATPKAKVLPTPARRYTPEPGAKPTNKKTPAKRHVGIDPGTMTAVVSMQRPPAKKVTKPVAVKKAPVKTKRTSSK